MLGLCVLLAVNYPDQKIQDKLVKKHAPAALIISATLFAAGAMVGIFDGTGMLEAMANAIMAVIPAAMGKYIHIIFGYPCPSFWAFVWEPMHIFTASCLWSCRLAKHTGLHP